VSAFGNPENPVYLFCFFALVPVVIGLNLTRTRGCAVASMLESAVISG